MITEEIKESNYAKYKRYLVNLIGEEGYDNLINVLGGEDIVKNASFGMSKDSGSAYDGALIENVIKIAQYAVKINDTLPDNIKCDNSSIYKVALLQHIGKILMYAKNDNDWEIKNRGMLYKFINNNVALRCGEFSIVSIIKAGIKINEEEYEAIRIIDKQKDDDAYSRVFSTTLSTIIRQSNELVSLINKKNA